MYEQTIYEVEARDVGGLRGRVTIVRRVGLRADGDESTSYDVQVRFTADGETFFFLDERNDTFEGLAKAREYADSLVVQMLGEVNNLGDLGLLMRKLKATRVNKELLNGERHFDGIWGGKKKMYSTDEEIEQSLAKADTILGRCVDADSLKRGY